MKNNVSQIIESVNKDSIESKKLSLFELFDTQNIFSVKEFQRKYEWGKNQFHELLNEIDKNGSNKDYFLGMIILKKEFLKDKTKTLELSIVDGQQRITTLFLVSKAIELNFKKYLNDLEDNNSVEDNNSIKELKSLYSIIDSNNDVNKLKISKLRGQDELRKILLDNETEMQEYNCSEINNKNPIYFQAFKEIDDWFKNKKEEEIKVF